MGHGSYASVLELAWTIHLGLKCGAALRIILNSYKLLEVHGHGPGINREIEQMVGGCLACQHCQAINVLLLISCMMNIPINGLTDMCLEWTGIIERLVQQ